MNFLSLSFYMAEAFMGSSKYLNEIQPGQKAVVLELKTEGKIHRRLLDIGFIKGTEVECVGRSPLGDPSAFLVRGAVIALREKECRKIQIYVNQEEWNGK